MDLIGIRISFILSAAALLSIASHAQAPVSASSTVSSSSSSSTSANDTPSTARRVILKVGNAQVTQADFEAGIGDFEGEKEEGSVEKERRSLGDDYASVLMLSQQALANHLDATPEVARELATERLQILSNAEFARLMAQAEPGAEEIKQYYSAHLSDYDEVQIRRLFIWKRKADSTPPHGLSPQDARSRADAILHASPDSKADSLADAFKNSEAGLLDAAPSSFPRGELPPAMEKVAFSMKPDGWAEVEDTPDRIILIHLVKRSPQALDQVTSLIEQRLQGRKMQIALDEMKKNTGIWMDEKYFGTGAAVPGAQANGNSPPPQLGKSVKRKEEKTNENDR